MKMRKILSLAIMLLSMTSNTTVLAVSENNEISAQCPPANDLNAGVLFMPHPVDCGSYYVCDWGHAILTTCPDGLHFNASLNTCDSIENAGCTASEE